MEHELDGLGARLRRILEGELGAPLERILNATGIFLHTNLGRSPLPRRVAESLVSSSDAYCDLEFDRETGRRGQRNQRTEALLRALTGAEAAVAVNNNAAALYLTLHVIAQRRAVPVSRGELVEIGGSFRIPEIMTAAGAKLIEVGTTNRTRLEDYRRAIGPDSALLLKVYPSNYRIGGFVEETSPAELVALGKEVGVPVLVDEGSGLLRPHPAPQLRQHPSVGELLGMGVDLVCSSADKLLGGPQAGLLFGRRELIEECRRSPLYRALRPSRLTLAALDGVLRMHLAGEPLPVDRLWPEPAAHEERVRALAGRMGAEVIRAEAFLGGGSAPERPVEGLALALAGDPALLERLRRGRPPVVGYLREERLVLDLRTIDPADDEALVEAVETALRSERP